MEESYIYFWAFDNGKATWVFGDSPTSSDHDIEVMEEKQSSNTDVCVDAAKIEHFKVW